MKSFWALPTAALIALVGLSPSASAAVPDRATMAALGDSITRAAVADGTTAAQPQNSWSTGSSSRVNSHHRRLEAAGVTVTAGNFSSGGDRSADLPGQATRAAATSPDYVTILIGANDICGASTLSGMTSATTFEANVRRALDTIKAANPDARVLLASVPNLMTLYRVGKSSITIRLRWAVIGICEIMLANPLDTSSAANSRRAAVLARVDAYNSTLRTLAAQRANVFYDNGAVYGTPFTTSDLSVLDGFHPSLNGQNKLAARTWDEAVRQGVFTV